MKIDPALKEDLKLYLEQKIADKGHKVILVSAYKLLPDEIQSIRNKFPVLKNAELTEVVDPHILGGFIIRFGSKMIDLSIKSELQKLQQRIYEII